MLKHTVYQQRRKRLLQKMQHGIAVIPTAPEMVRNGDAHFPYRFGSHFHYLSGFAEPEAVVVLVTGQENNSPP